MAYNHKQAVKELNTWFWQGDITADEWSDMLEILNKMAIKKLTFKSYKA